MLRRLRDSYQEDLADVLGALYEHDPHASDELHALLDTYVEDRATRDRVLHRVAEARQD